MYAYLVLPNKFSPQLNIYASTASCAQSRPSPASVQPHPIYLWPEVNGRMHSQDFLPAGARAARERLVLRLLYVFRVCLFVCLFVIVRPHLSRAQYITSYVTMQLQCIAAIGGLRAKPQQMKVGLCCLDGERGR